MALNCLLGKLFVIQQFESSVFLTISNSRIKLKAHLSDVVIRDVTFPSKCIKIMSRDLKRKTCFKQKEVAPQTRNRFWIAFIAVIRTKSLCGRDLLFAVLLDVDLVMGSCN